MRPGNRLRLYLDLAAVAVVGLAGLIVGFFDRLLRRPSKMLSDQYQWPRVRFVEKGVDIGEGRILKRLRATTYVGGRWYGSSWDLDGTCTRRQARKLLRKRLGDMVGVR